ncbi:MAG: hypothetical protein KDB08_10285 [Microthrixaceae bacterium]|nr:hypothetical protein [Microthrixaceae bacterium]
MVQTDDCSNRAATRIAPCRLAALVVIALATVALAACSPPPTAIAAEGSTQAPAAERFGEYRDIARLSEVAPGTVLKTRSVQYRFGDLWFPFEVE